MAGRVLIGVGRRPSTTREDGGEAYFAYMQKHHPMLGHRLSWFRALPS
jgi:hypothetical protein